MKIHKNPVEFLFFDLFYISFLMKKLFNCVFKLIEDILEKNCWYLGWIFNLGCNSAPKIILDLEIKTQIKTNEKRDKKQKKKAQNSIETFCITLNTSYHKR